MSSSVDIQVAGLKVHEKKDENQLMSVMESSGSALMPTKKTILNPGMQRWTTGILSISTRRTDESIGHSTEISGLACTSLDGAT